MCDKFWSQVIKTESCWNWDGIVNGKGYGQISIKGTNYFTHRYSWEIHNGIISKGMQVLHKCDNRLCVNPDHLFLGTHQDNMDDKVNKNRQSRLCGQDNPKSKLTNNDVIDILNMFKEGIKDKDIANLFNVSIYNIRDIKYKKRWRKFIETYTQGGVVFLKKVITVNRMCHKIFLRTS